MKSAAIGIALAFTTFQVFGQAAFPPPPPKVSPAVGGLVTTEMEAILKIIARENLVLATGHIHPEEVIAVVRRARELGVKNIVVTHWLTNVPGLTMEQAKQVVEMGAMIEVCFERRPQDRMPEDNPWGFRMKVPALLYDRDELHNLAIGRAAA